MRNQVTVTVSIPWIENISESDYKTVYNQILSIARNESSISHTEANHLISGMTQRKKTYSYDVSPDEINFQSYANLSQYVPDKALTVQIGKVGTHVQTGPQDDAKYYNIVFANFSNGKMDNQIIGHMEPTEGALIENYVTLTGTQMKSKLSSLKNVAVSEAAKHAPKAPVLNPDLVYQAEAETADFGL